MKKFALILLFIMLFSMLSGCSNSRTVTYNNREYTLNTAEKTVTDGTNTYRYELDGTESHPSVKIIYPDGSSYYSVKQGNAYISGNSDDYGNYGYTEGGILCDIVFEGTAEKTDAKVIILSLVLIAIGVISIIAPRKMWYLNYGWRFKNAEPSDVAIVLNRVCGAVLVVIGLVFIFA